MVMYGNCFLISVSKKKIFLCTFFRYLYSTARAPSCLLTSQVSNKKKPCLMDCKTNIIFSQPFPRRHSQKDCIKILTLGHSLTYFGTKFNTANGLIVLQAGTCCKKVYVRSEYLRFRVSLLLLYLYNYGKLHKNINKS